MQRFQFQLLICMAMAVSFSFLLMFLFPIAALSSTPSKFVFHGFKDFNTSSLSGKASIDSNSGLLMLTDSSESVIGRAFYPSAQQMFEESSESTWSVSSFSTNFVFAMVGSRPGVPIGHGLAFVLAPSTQFPGAESGDYFGLFNPSNSGSSSNHILAVEFDTVNRHKENLSKRANHVGININGIDSEAYEAAEYSKGSNAQKEEIYFDSGDPIQVWIEYDRISKHLNVTIAPIHEKKPTDPLIAHELKNLTNVLNEKMYVGFSASTGKETSFQYISGWSFAINGPAPALNISGLPPIPPAPGLPPSFNPLITVLVASLSAVTLLGILFLVIILKRRLQGETLEEWEKDYPHRFNFKDLYKATKGFKDSELVGSGGFGSVYKGVLLSTGCEIAVKKVTRNSSQGIREFAAEIESLGRLRHKNLVNLQGWCKNKNDLLLVYDYIPNGSLYSLLYHPKSNLALNWEQRFKIIKGIAAGLLYLHEEWEQVVIHRDIKPSNVLIDDDMNARLSDFGLARLYNHDQISHTTSVVGTVGYISPELARMGKASKITDVFAYGVLLLEVACGRRPLESDLFILVDWVMECHERGRILDAADPKLNAVYEINEMEMVLHLGLHCSHHEPQARPTMREVIRYLNGEDQIVPIDPLTYSQDIQKSNLGFSGYISENMISSSSTALISSTSIDIGR